MVRLKHSDRAEWSIRCFRQGSRGWLKHEIAVLGGLVCFRGGVAGPLKHSDKAEWPIRCFKQGAGGWLKHGIME